MTPADFRAWRLELARRDGDHSGMLSVRATAKLLDMATNTVLTYSEDGNRIPRVVGLACHAVLYGLPEWQAPPETNHGGSER